MDFYHSTSSSACRSVIMLSKILGIKFNKKPLNLLAGEHLTPEFLKINPQHTIPTIVDDGLAIWESRAILAYLVEEYAQTYALYPRCHETRALVNQRLYFDMGTLYKSFGEYFYPQCLHKTPADPEKLKKLEEALELLDIYLVDNTFVTGDFLTIADIAILASISTFDVAGVDLKKYENVSRWYEFCKRTVPGFEENWLGALLFAQKWKDIKDGKTIHPYKK